jgi:predicted ArsR family transcriptional regulator
LAINGYEPRRAGRRITLANCPFHDLASAYTELMCGLNVDLIQGMLDAVPASRLRAALDPAPGRCCVTVSVGASTRSQPGTVV